MTFEEPGHPTIKLLEDRISIKAIDYSAFREFKFDHIESIKFYRPYENSLLGFLLKIDPFWSQYWNKEDYVLRINLKDGEHWDYNTTYKYSTNFIKIIEISQSRLTTILK